MNLLAITQHMRLVEGLRTAFEGPPARGHVVTSVADPLEALAREAWDGVQLVLVDAQADPMSGYRLCCLLRAHPPCRNLPVFLGLDHPATEAEEAEREAAGADGFVALDASSHTLKATLGPFLTGDAGRRPAPAVPLLAQGLRRGVADRIEEALQAHGFELHRCTRGELPAALASLRPALLFLGVEPEGTKTCELLQELPELPFTILVGGRIPAATQLRLLESREGGGLDWLSLPVSVPLLLQGCRRALAALHGRRLGVEYQRLVRDVCERRLSLEREISALRDEVLTDPLTELLNRRAFTQNLEHAVNQWERHQRSFVLILGDLDYFKLINDRFGHQVGDQVLKAMGQRIRASLRRSDLAFRIGGEEFAILLLETSLNAGAEVAEKIRARIEEIPVTASSGQHVFPTMSFGVGTADGLAISQLFSRVDEALYLAKHKGRNRVEVVSA